MKTIGMLGGMSWESTVEYYRLANELVRERLGGVHSAKIILDSLDFAEVEQLQSAGDWKRAGELLAARAVRLERAGAELMVLCTNTMHLVIDAIEAAISIPVVHIVDATAERVVAAGCERVGLLGTAFTMQQPFYRDRLVSHGIDVIVPDTAAQTVVHDVIYNELVRGTVSGSSRGAYRDIIGELVESGAQGVVLGCTEIELLVGPSDSSVPVFPTTRIHVEAAVDLALASQ